MKTTTPTKVLKVRIKGHRSSVPGVRPTGLVGVGGGEGGFGSGFVQKVDEEKVLNVYGY